MLQINTLDKLHLGIQGENKATTIRIDMSAWAAEYPDAVFNVIFQPHDSTLVYPMVTSYDSETKVLSWTISNAVTAEPGECKTEIRAQDSETSLVKKSRIIPSFVAPSVTGTETEPPEPQEEWVTEVLEARDEAEAAAEAAEAYAIGKRGGTDVDPDDPAYHNNSKYYSQQAGDSATTAGNAQEAAETARTAAETAEENAKAYAIGKRGGTDVDPDDPAYHNNSKYYSQQAGDSAAAAAESKRDSEAYAIGKRDGVDVEITDPTYNNNSKYWSDSAWEAAQHAASSTIDDTAGAGTTDKTWSANKLVNEFAGKANLENGKVPTSQIPFDKIYPIGSIYMSVSSTSPATLFGGTWDRLKSRFLLGAEDAGETTGDPYIGGATGGAASVSYTPAGTVDGHTLTTDEIPSHSHGLNAHTHSYTYPTGSTQGNSGNTSETTINFSNGAACFDITYNSAYTWLYQKTRSAPENVNSNYGIRVTGTSTSASADGIAKTALSGSQSHTHTHNGHTHTVNTGSTNTGGNSDNTTSTGGGGSHNHGFTGTQATINTMPPFLSVYMRKRTA